MEPLPEAEDPSCTFGQCFCRWLRFCSSRIPHVGPGRDYERVPCSDGRAAWSVLLGFIALRGANNLLYLRRFRVAQSGRVLGRSDDALDALDDLDYGAKGMSLQLMAAGATPSPDGCSLSLCLFSQESPPLGEIVPPRPLELLLDLTADRRITVSPLPELQQDALSPTRPISAGGHLWAPYFTQRCPSSLLMRRLDKESGQWVPVGATFHPPHEQSDCGLHGYTVIHDTILLSLRPPHLFLVFNCSTYEWKVVLTTTNKQYIPIIERGLYVEEDDTIYILCDGIVFAYKLCYDQDQDQYWMAPPIIVDRINPFRDEGCGFITHLGSRVMCFVWISVPFRRSELRCNCDTLHVLITTFQVMSNHESFVPKGVRVLHSTCRRLDIRPSMSIVDNCVFCFMLDYEELYAMPPSKKMRENTMLPSMLLEGMESSKLLTCCRKFLNDTPFNNAVMFGPSTILPEVLKHLHVICQFPSHSTVYEIRILNGKLARCNLEPHCVMDTFVCDDKHDLMERPLQWHFVCDSMSIYAVPYKKSEIYVCSLSLVKPVILKPDIIHTTRPADDDFAIALVVQVGHKIIAVSDTLRGVYCLSDKNEWERIDAFGCADSNMKVNLSGYVVLSNKYFMVSEAETSCCHLFDLISCTWRVVKPYDEIKASLQVDHCFFGSGFFRGRSAFAEGFIYTCANGGLVAYEAIELEDSYYLGSSIYLEIPWRKLLEGNSMCLDFVGKNKNIGTIMFCVVQGSTYPCPGAPGKDPVWITTVQVKTERMPDGKWKPLGIGLVDAGTFFIKPDGHRQIWTSSCFAVAGFAG